MNQIRALLLERGYIMPQGKATLAKRLTELLEEGASDLAPRIVSLIKDMRDQWLSLDQRITCFDMISLNRRTPMVAPAVWYQFRVLEP